MQSKGIAYLSTLDFLDSVKLRYWWTVFVSLSSVTWKRMNKSNFLSETPNLHRIRHLSRRITNSWNPLIQTDHVNCPSHRWGDFSTSPYSGKTPQPEVPYISPKANLIGRMPCSAIGNLLERNADTTEWIETVWTRQGSILKRFFEATKSKVVSIYIIGHPMRSKETDILKG